MPVIIAFGIGPQEIIVIAVIIIVLFGATKLPQLGSAVGQGIRNFKRGMREVKAEEEEAKRLEAQKQAEASQDAPENHTQDKS